MANRVRATRSRWLALAWLLLALAGCGGSGPMWVTAPLLADTSRDVSGPVPDRPFDETLLVGEDAYAELKFSLDTLPSGVLSRLVIENGAATIGSENYALTPEKVFRARLVLFVDEVLAEGYLRVDGAYAPGGDCFADEATPPSCTQTVAGAQVAADADSPGQALRITQRGYYSVDVTDLVRDRLRHGYAGILRVQSARDPQANDWGRFRFASKEKVMGGAFVHHHQPQLLVTLTDAAGMTSSAFITSTVQNSQSDPTLAGRDFSQDPQMLMNGQPAEIAYAITQPRGLPTGGLNMRSFLGQIGTRAYKMTMTTSLDAPVPFSAQDPARIDWYRRGKLFNPANNNHVITWNNGWSEPPPSALIASNSLSSDVPSQPLLTELSSSYVDALRIAYATDTSEEFAVAGKTNVQGPLTLEARYNAQTARAPRFVSVIVPVPVNSFYTFDINDSTRALKYCIGTSVTGALCDAPALSLRARAGQPYPAAPIIVDIRSLDADSNVPYAAPIHIDVPPTGASVDMDVDPNPDDQALAAGIADAPGYYLSVRRANDVVGAFQGIISMPGHNLRAAIEFTNLPLPVPSLSGPARIVLPAGQASVSVPADADDPFVLDVDDAVVAANIDDTTRWRFSSSDASDTMPGELQQTDGHVNLALTFGSTGPRTITVRSRGDERIAATLEVIVDGGSTTTLAAPGPIVFGQPVTLTAQVAGQTGAPLDAGSVEFRDGADVLGSGEIVGGAVTFTTSGLAVGVHMITAHYAGDPAGLVAGSASVPLEFEVERATTAIALSAPAGSLIGAPVAVDVTLGVIAPGAGTPSGTVTVSDGEVSCTYALDTAAGCSLTPAAAGARSLVATYSGDANFRPSQASAPLTVYELPSLVSSLASLRDYVPYGHVADYLVTLRNDGPGPAMQVPVDTNLSAAFDLAFARWQCFGAGAGATCADGGSGLLHDVVTIPAGRSLTFLISAPVRPDTSEAEAVLAFDVGGPAPLHFVDSDVLVLLRDGFDEAYASGTAMDAEDAAASLSDEGVHAFVLPPASGPPFDRVLALPYGVDFVEVQRAPLDGATALVRLSRRDARGIERVSPWVRAAADAVLALSAVHAGDAAVTLLLEGTQTPLAMTLPGAD
ncbi:Ig-like domain repeat protein [Dokdonella ginsengisoli]|uniref:Ig-like domain repeat protein n=1 Tax=Dokdonella ginsengisoli TaxID=363846 RepID=A0ABV9QW33_9GAMM